MKMKENLEYFARQLFENVTQVFVLDRSPPYGRPEARTAAVRPSQLLSGMIGTHTDKRRSVQLQIVAELGHFEV